MIAVPTLCHVVGDPPNPIGFEGLGMTVAEHHVEQSAVSLRLEARSLKMWLEIEVHLVEREVEAACECHLRGGLSQSREIIDRNIAKTDQVARSANAGFSELGNWVWQRGRRLRPIAVNSKRSQHVGALGVHAIIGRSSIAHSGGSIR